MDRVTGKLKATPKIAGAGFVIEGGLCAGTPYTYIREPHPQLCWQARSNTDRFIGYSASSTRGIAAGRLALTQLKALRPRT